MKSRRSTRYSRGHRYDRIQRATTGLICWTIIASAIDRRELLSRRRRQAATPSGAEGPNVGFRSITLLLCLLSSLNAFATRRHSHSHRSSFRFYSTRSTRQGRYKRSTTAKNNFKREHPCPATGKSSGSCPGYVIGHINPLECGGADAQFNMQWQTIAEGKRRIRQSGTAGCKQRFEHLIYSRRDTFAFVCLSTSYRSTLPECESLFVNVKCSSGARSARPEFPALLGDDPCCRPPFSATCAEPSAPTDHRKSSLAPFGVFGSDRRISSGNERHAALQTLARCMRCLRETHASPSVPDTP
jgi:hypothetical protein